MPEPINDTSKHIAVLAFPFGTHAAPLLKLVRRLLLAAPEAKFSFFSTAQSNSSIFPKNEIFDNVKPYNVRDGLPENYTFSRNPLEPVELFLKATPRNFVEALGRAVEERGRKITCIMSDAFFWFAADLAQEMHVPWVPLWTAGPRSLLLHIETDLIRQKLRLHESKDTAIDFIPGCSAIRAIDLPQEILLEDIKSPFAAMLHNMGLALPQAAAVATNSFEELDPSSINTLKSRLQNFLNVGPFALTSPESSVPDPQNCLEWLNKQSEKSVVYISFGSVIVPPPDEIAALAEALEASECPFLWSIRGNVEENLPKGFLERTKEKGKIVSWTPQINVLQHNATGVFITHCGWNSILETIISCVPMICRPFFGDQHLNARKVEAIWEIGMGFQGGKITKDGTLEALHIIMSTEEGEKIRKRLKVFQDLALNAVQPNGSSTKNFETLVEVVTK